MSFVTDVRLARRSFVRDVVFFIGTVLYLLAVTLDGVITLPEAVGFVVIYILFVAVVAGGRWFRALRTEDEGSSAFGSAGGEGPGAEEASGAAAIVDDHGLGSSLAVTPGGGAAAASSFQAPAVAQPGAGAGATPLNALDAARRAALVASYQRAQNKVMQQKFFLQTPSAVADGAHCFFWGGDLRCVRPSACSTTVVLGDAAQMKMRTKRTKTVI